jgi:hypothetical protein
MTTLKSVDIGDNIMKDELLSVKVIDEYYDKNMKKSGAILTFTDGIVLVIYSDAPIPPDNLEPEKCGRWEILPNPNHPLDAFSTAEKMERKLLEIVNNMPTSEDFFEIWD